MTKRILVIGGTRFIGRSIIRHLLESGHEVHYLHRGFSQLDISSDRLFEHQSNAHNGLYYRKLFKQYSFDFIIHTIAYKPEDLEVLFPVLQADKTPLIVISTGQVYLVTLPPKEEYTEEDYHRMIMHSPEDEYNYAQWEYGVLKRNMEDLLTEWYQKFGISSLTLRSPVVHGERDYSYRLYSYIWRLTDDEQFLLLPSGGNPVLSHIWVEDLAKAVGSVVSRGFHGRQCFNISMNEKYPLTEWIFFMEKVLQRRVPVYMPSTDISEEEHMMLVQASPFSGKWVSVLNANKFKKAYGWEPTPFDRWFPDVVLYQFKHFSPENLKNRAIRPRETELYQRLKKEGQIIRLS